jgi:hypothetical protein
VDLRPGRDKCLFCHGEETVRKRLLAEDTIDVRRYEPSPEKVMAATKVNIPKDAPMQFSCYECHKPHEQARPNWDLCLKCHGSIPDVGKHGLHINVMGMQCKQCHKPHVWKVTKEIAKKDCTMCHEYKEPSKFIQG